MKYTFFLWPLLAVVFVFTLYGFTINRITVRNGTAVAVSVATYRVKKGGTAVLEDGPTRIESKKAVALIRPSFKYGYETELFFVSAADESLLQKELSPEQWESISALNVGRIKGFNFVISQENVGLQAEHSLALDVGMATLYTVLSPTYVLSGAVSLAQSSPLLMFLRWQIKKAVFAAQPAIRKNPYRDTVARVREGNELPQGEKAYRAARKPIVKKALEKFLVTTIPDVAVPTIALVGSGGGFRAMAGTTGFLRGAHDIGLLDTATYVVGLSGSTWALGVWNATGCSVPELSEKMIKKMPQGIKNVDGAGLRKIVDALLVKWALGQESTLVDFYGALLANTLLDEFGNARQWQHLSEQAKLLVDGSRVLPIYSSVSAKESKDRFWYEYTPFEIGSARFGLYVPSWAYGRKFNKGVSLDFAPEQSFGYLMGTFGSAFALTVERMLKEKANLPEGVFVSMFEKVNFQKVALQSVVFAVVQPLLQEILKTRVSAGRIWNYTYGMPTSSLADKSKLSFVDAGLDFNLPYPPISGERPERMADVIIFLDSSAGVIGAPELRKVERYARTHDLKFPSIIYKGIGERAVSIFKDETDVSVPLVIYMPQNKDQAAFELAKKEKGLNKYIQLLKDFDREACVKKSFCDTFNFGYTQDQVRQLMALTEFNMLVSARSIREAIQFKVTQLARKSVQAPVSASVGEKNYR